MIGHFAMDGEMVKPGVDRLVSTRRPRRERRRASRGTAIVMAGLVLVTACGPSEVPPIPAVTEPAPNPHAAERVAELGNLAASGEADLLFVGDSITQGWRRPGRDVWERYYGHRRALNFGVSGDEIPHLLWRIERGHFDHVRPRLVVLLIGTNDTLHHRRPPEEIARGVEAVLAALRGKLPSARFLLLGIFPTAERADDPYRVNNDAANRLLARLDDGNTVHYRDIGARFTGPDGSISRDVMPDLLHLSTRGYEIWAESIEPDVRELLGE